MQMELVLADIQQAFFEYRANFKKPITIFWSGGRQAEIIDAMYKALAPWRVELGNIAWQQSAKNLSEIQLSFAVPSQFASVQVGVAGVTLTALNPDWSRAPELITLFQASLGALRASTGQEFESQQTTLGFHLKPPAARPFRDVVTQFVNAESLGRDAAMFGVSVYYSDHTFVVDASGAIQGGLFVKLVRNFTAEKQFEDMAKALYADEEAVLQRLGLKLQ
ncbi:MAG: hypothetical protein WAN76_19740 [Candidatus Sulfotelmatobacter sp.]